MKYIITVVEEVWITYEVDAENDLDAERMYMDGYAKEVDSILNDVYIKSVDAA